MKIFNVAFATLTLLSAVTQAQSRGYYGFDRATGEVYRSDVYVDSCPRDKFPECPRKWNDYYSELIQLIKKQLVEIKIEVTEEIRLKNYGYVNDRPLILAAQAAIVSLENQAKAKNPNLSIAELVTIISRDHRLVNTSTFSAIVRLIESTDRLEK